jgi:mono/diheme cytochrome c family protein
VNPFYLEAFIRNPHGIKPGTTMPDVLAEQSDEEKNEAAKALTHFLLSLKKNDFTPTAPDAVAAGQGKVLFHSRGCAACHSPRDDQGVELSPKNSVPLGALDRKYSFKSLTHFLQQPHVSRPSLRMPDMQLAPREIERISHFLLQNTRVPGPLAYTLYRGEVYEGLESENVTAERAGLVKDFALASLGKIQQHTAITYKGWLNLAHKGSYTFFLEMNGGSLLVDGQTLIRQDPSDRRGVKVMEATAELAAGWRKIELDYIHTGREARLSFEMAGPQFPRGPIPSERLSISNETTPAFEAPQLDARLASRGREYFETLGCANCHDDLKVPAKPGIALAKLDSTRGCLSDADGSWPRFDLTEEQRQWITRALPHAERPQLDDQQRINKTLVTLNCTACHERKGLGGISPERSGIFTGTLQALGDQGRLPPPLTQIGAKLKPEWISEVLLSGQRERRYLDASMPQFGAANVGHLVDLFGKVDELETLDIPPIANMKESRDAGYQMIGTEGFGCIACHEFNGQKSGEMGALDLSRLSGRLKKNWFHLFMRQPSRFHPTVIMPSYWPGGQSTRPNVLAGDTGQQIEALWTYLSDGARAKRPIGLSRGSNELRVGDVAEICRGRGPAGFRGVGVGYPERIHLAFDSEEMALRQLWKGEFANVDFGSFKPRGTEMISLPPGIPFHRLASLEDQWPYKGKTNYLFPRDMGYRFRGYHLDEMRRPTFRYLYGEVAVTDFFEDIQDPDGGAFFKRTLTFEAPNDQSPFYFRAAAGNKAGRKSDRILNVDSLQVRITSDHKGILREGNPSEILIPLTLAKGGTTLTLEYRW